MKNSFFERRCRYSIRKLSVGACSLMIGAVLFAGPAWQKKLQFLKIAELIQNLFQERVGIQLVKPDKQNEGERTGENKLEKAEGAETVSETASPASNEAATTETAEASKRS